MKKLMLLVAIGVLFANCQQEEITTETSADLTMKTADSDLDVVPNKYFGVLSTFDTQIHGELRINMEAETEFQAIVTLVNKDILKFKAIVNRTNPSLVDFKGNAGSFTIDFTDKSNLVASNFLVDNKEGYIVVFPEPRRGGQLLLGSYVDTLDPAFNGNWDMFNFGMIDPGTGWAIIELTTIDHTGGLFFVDETEGVLEAFNSCVAGQPVIGGIVNGTTISAINQIATFNGVATTWNMNVSLGRPHDPINCTPSPGAPDGTWIRGARSGTLTILSF